MSSVFLDSGETPDTSLLFHDPHSDELAAQLLAFISDPYEASLPALDAIFDDDQNGQTNIDANGFHNNSTYTLTPEFQHLEGGGGDHEFFFHHHHQCPKRLRSTCDDFHQGHHSLGLAREISPAPLASRCLSAQSVAARERRRRISEKTQELGRLIPGGNRMNTAEMFEAGYKYVKFLQAQVGILDLMASLQECKAAQQVEEQLQALLAVGVIQERLYGEGRCLVPKLMVEAIAEDQDIRSNQLLFRDLTRFVGSIR